MKNIRKRYAFDVTDHLHQLGDRIALARKSRVLRQEDVASMAGISRSTYIEIEKGSPYVEMGNYASALWALNLLPHLDRVASPDEDREAQAILGAALPRRVRT